MFGEYKKSESPTVLATGRFRLRSLGAVAILIGVAHLAGCGPRVRPETLGTIIYKASELPGAASPDSSLERPRGTGDVAPAPPDTSAN